MGVIVLVFPVAFIALVLAGHRWLRRQGYRPSQPVPDLAPRHEFGSEAIQLTGGARVGWWNATWPFVKLVADRDYVCLRTTLKLARPVWIPRVQVTAIQRVSSPLGGGIRFETADGAYDGVIYWSFSVPEALAALGGLGWPVRQGDNGSMRTASQP